MNAVVPRLSAWVNGHPQMMQMYADEYAADRLSSA